MPSRVWVLMLRLGFPPSALLLPEGRGFTALVTRPAALYWWRAGYELRHFTKVLGGGGQRKFVVGSRWTA